MAADQIKSFIKTYSEALVDRNAAVFVGAGLSIPAGMVDWKELLRDIASDVGLDVDKESDLVTVAQYHFNKLGRHKINQALVNEFASRASLTENHRIIASLPIDTIWTTNYDTLIEEALRRAGKTPDTKITVPNLTTTRHRRDAVVYKMHGDVSLPDEAILTKEDYETYELKRSLFSTALQGDLVSKTFLFVGFSFNDPNLNYVLGRIRMLLGSNVRHHYCLLRRVRQKDFETRSQFHYAQAKQQLQVEDLRRYGIIGLLLDDYSDYTRVLNRVSDRYRRSRVFVSGSAVDYAPWPEAQARQLITDISRLLARSGFGVVSGFGIGVGQHVINGVLEQLDAERTRVIDDRLTLKPFPQDIVDPAERKRRWTEYRQQILAEVGITIFLFGNRRDARGRIVPANGIEEEFKIAVQRGVAVVPVGCTGGVAAILHKRVAADLRRHFPKAGYARAFVGLAKKRSGSEVASKVVAFVEKLRDDA